MSFLGRITQQKGPGFFVEAANRILQKRKNVRFIMAGKGNLRDAMIRRTEELKISGHFEFSGFLNDDEIVELFEKSDVFVMPSVSEPFGIVALEALQAGVPLVISKQSGVSEVLNNVSRVDYWDIRGLANAITDLLDDAAKYNKLRSNGLKEVNKLRWENSASQIRNIYLSLLKS